MPFFAIKNVVLRLRAVGIANIVIIHLSVLLVWLLCTEIGLNRKAKILTAVIASIWPDMMFAMTYMSEVLFWPLTLLIFWLWLVNERRQSYIIAVVEGLICYFAYLTKEIALAFLIAYSAFEVIYPVLSRAHSEHKYSRKRFILLAVYMISFLLCHIVMKLTLFSGLGNSYNQMSIGVILSAYNFTYMIYAFFYYIAAILIASLIIPFVYPAVNFKYMNQASRKLFVYAVLYGLITSAAIAYTISVRESLGQITPSIHLRYYGAFFIVILAVFFCVMQSVTSDDIQNSRRLSAEVLAVTALYSCFIFRGIISTTSADQYILLWYMAVEKIFKPLFPPEGKWAVFYPSAVTAGILLCTLVVLFHRIYTRRGKTQAQKFFVTVLLIMTAGLNAAVGTVIDYAYHVDTDTVNEIIKLNDYFSANKTSNILYLNYGKSSERYDRFNRYADTYIEYRNNFYIADDAEVMKHINSGGAVNVIDIQLGTKPIQSIDYIMLERLNSSGKRPLANVEPIEELCGKHFVVYKNIDPSVLQFE